MNLAVIFSHFNPARFSTPTRLLQSFVKRLDDRGVPWFCSELAHGSQPYDLPEAENVFRFRCGMNNVFWHKENLLNMTASRVPPRYDALAWIDPDVTFENPQWLQATLEALEYHSVVQMFDLALWLDENGAPEKALPSTASAGSLKVGSSHPGFAWAARRNLWSEGGGLCERAIIGGGDAVMAAAIYGGDIPSYTYYENHHAWTAGLKSWVDSQGGGGCVPGTIVHHWHGSHTDRNYIKRFRLVRDLNIDEALVKDNEGLLEFVETIPQTTRQAFLEYFTARHEDGNPEGAMAS